MEMGSDMIGDGQSKLYGKLFDLVNIAEHLRDEERIEKIKKYTQTILKEFVWKGDLPSEEEIYKICVGSSLALYYNDSMEEIEKASKDLAKAIKDLYDNP